MFVIKLVTICCAVERICGKFCKIPCVTLRSNCIPTARSRGNAESKLSTKVPIIVTADEIKEPAFCPTPERD